MDNHDSAFQYRAIEEELSNRKLIAIGIRILEITGKILNFKFCINLTQISNAEQKKQGIIFL